MNEYRSKYGRSRETLGEGNLNISEILDRQPYLMGEGSEREDHISSIHYQHSLLHCTALRREAERNGNKSCPWACNGRVVESGVANILVLLES